MESTKKVFTRAVAIFSLGLNFSTKMKKLKEMSWVKFCKMKKLKSVNENPKKLHAIIFLQKTVFSKYYLVCKMKILSDRVKIFFTLVYRTFSYDMQHVVIVIVIFIAMFRIWQPRLLHGATLTAATVLDWVSNCNFTAVDIKP